MEENFAEVLRKGIMRSLFLVFLLSFTQLSACLADGEYQKTPLSKKIDISQPNFKTEMLVHIRVEDNYAFSLDFKTKNQEERDKVNILLRPEDANGRQTNGEKTPISIDVYTVKDGQNVLVSIGGAESIPVSIWGSGRITKEVYRDYLFPGNYRVVINTKEGNPIFKDVDVEVRIGKAPRPK